MGIPVELWDVVLPRIETEQAAMKARGITYAVTGSRMTQDKTRLRCKVQSELTSFMTECAKILLAVEIVKTDVIVYLAESQYWFVPYGGRPYVNEEHATQSGAILDKTDSRRNWVKSQTKNARNMFHDEFPTGLMVAVGVFTKETITRGNATAYRYTSKYRYNHGDNETAALRLSHIVGLDPATITKHNAGVNGNIDKQLKEVITKSCYSEMPLTEENAAFFLNVITSLQMMAYKFNSFFADNTALQAAIANQTAAPMISFAGSNDSE